MKFASSDSDYRSSRYVICGVMFDGTSSFRTGSRWAPEAIRKGSYNFEPYDYDYDLCEPSVYDMGDVEFGNVDDMIAELQPTIFGIINDGKVPITLGGEHSITLPCLKAFVQEADTTAVIFDAHLDFKENYLGNKCGHASVAWNVFELSIPLVQIGVRSGSKIEYERARDGSALYTMSQIRDEGIGVIIDEVVRSLKTDTIYLSIDVDVVDPAFAPGVGNPEPYGLTPLELRTAIRRLAPLVGGFDMVEITPDYDLGISAILGAKLTLDFIFAHANAHQNLI